MMNDLQGQVRRTIETHGLLRPRDTVVIAVSGGPDSVALLHLLTAMRTEYDLTLHVAHLNHQLRPDAAEDAEFVRGVASQLDLPVHIVSVDVRALATDKRLSLEEAGRQARYALYTRVAAATGASRVATGHTRDDQVETVAMRLLQNAPWGVLAGIPVARPLGSVTVVRPLREAVRAQIVEYLHARRLTWRVDPSNRDQRFVRNWVRETWLPSLDTRAPQGRRLLWEIGTAAQDADRLLWAAAARVVEGAKQTRSTVTFALQVLHGLPSEVVGRAMRLAIRQIRGTELLPRDVSAVGRFDITSRRVGQEMRVGRCAVRRGYETAEVTVVEPDVMSMYDLPVPGRIDARAFGVVVTAEVLDRALLPQVVSGRSDAVYLDAHAVGAAVGVRSWRPGDRVAPLGLRGSKKVHDIFVDGKVPRWQRSRVPLVTDARGQILWIVGHTIADSAKITSASTKVVQLRVGP
ncbi:MAG TPA: tRNA lysidine(34) synthetase TilS [bacterium]|nr:tRNA lysidine(34) synthetase TilS [bacterium]